MRALFAAILIALGGVALAAAARYDGPGGSFDYPAGWKVEPAADVTLEPQLAVRVVAPPSTRPRVVSVTVLVGAHRIGEENFESKATAWHNAHLKNRVAWGMRSAGGLPRDEVRIAGRHAIRFRDHVGSALGADEQTSTCVLVSGRLGCVLVSAFTDARDRADQVAAEILGSLSVRRR